MPNNIFKSPDPVRVEVEGQPVLIRPMSAGELAAVYHMDTVNKATPWKSSFTMLSLCVLSTDGNKLFPTVEDAEAIPQSVAVALMTHVKKLNGLDTHDEKKD